MSQASLDQRSTVHKRIAMKVFVTGATGYLGAEVVALLLKDGHDVRGLVRSEAGATKLMGLGVKPVIGTLDQTDVLTKAASAGRSPAPPSASSTACFS